MDLVKGEWFDLYGRTSYYKLKKQAVEYLGFYFYEIVLPQARSKRWKPSLDESEEYLRISSIEL